MGISFVQFHLYFWKISKFDFDYFLQVKSVACVLISETLCTYIYMYTEELICKATIRETQRLTIG